VLLTCDGRRSKEIDTRIGKSNTVLRELYPFVVTKVLFSATANVPIFWSCVLDNDRKNSIPSPSGRDRICEEFMV